MTAAGIDDVSEFPARLEAEFKFLKSLTSEAEEDSLQMEYYQRLVNLGERWYVLMFPRTCPHLPAPPCTPITPSTVLSTRHRHDHVPDLTPPPRTVYPHHHGRVHHIVPPPRYQGRNFNLHWRTGRSRPRLLSSMRGSFTPMR